MKKWFENFEGIALLHNFAGEVFTSTTGPHGTNFGLFVGQKM